MSMPKDETQGELIDAWRSYLNQLDQSLTKIEENLNEASGMTDVCTDEWCEATEHVIDDIANSLFTIHEPKFSSPEDSKRIKDLKKRVYELYANYKDVYKKAGAGA
ncbi:MAG: hypothetical protein ACOCWY_05655 [Thermodesulfobacteriota bacterium]